MYRLYDYDVHSLIDKSEDEGDIVNTIAVFMEASYGTMNQRFLIKHTDEATHTDSIVATIKNVRDYYNYVTEYNDRLKRKSCVELKREIVQKVKTKGTRK